ncbi:MAG TPA: tetratricopeptide repeat protein, partial [Methanocorpusculum sp.]|nr:tetratricopeptide repeat protein [Methanocorpusculum sp.]
ALAIDPANSAAFVNKAHALVALGENGEAESVLRNGKEAVPEDERIAKMLANLLVRTGKWEEALTIADEVLLVTPEDDEVWSIKGAACAYLGRKDEAVAAFGKAMKINPKEKSYKQNRDAIKKS